MHLPPVASIAKLFLPSLAFLTWSSLALGASPAEEAAARLTGGSSREWIFKQMRVFMGPDQTCLEGETYRFSSDKSLSIEKCVNGKINKTVKKWSIEESGPLDVIIKIADEPLILLFNDSGGIHFMRLRKQGHSKISPTLDKEFRFSED